MSLHWILALTLTLLHCLTARPTTKSTIYTDDAFLSISKLQNLTCSETDSMFYSPSGNECIIQALNCSIQELNTVKAECFGKDSIEGFQYASRLSDLIEMMLGTFLTQNSSPNCSCEGRSPTLPYHGFLENVKTLIQNLNSIEQSK